MYFHTVSEILAFKVQKTVDGLLSLRILRIEAKLQLQVQKIKLRVFRREISKLAIVMTRENLLVFHQVIGELTDMFKGHHSTDRLKEKMRKFS